ncbi:MAG: cysteine hydrolase family protein, partial [Acidimicrobiales bacterium]
MGTTALLVMDFQVGVVQRVAEGSEVLLETVNRATTAARDYAIAVIYVQVAFRPGAPEISARNRIFSAIANSGTLSLNDSTTQIHPAIAPREDDIVVTKKRVSAFTGSDLDVVLRSLDVESLVLAGIATSGVVLSTLRLAADL